MKIKLRTFLTKEYLRTSRPWLILSKLLDDITTTREACFKGLIWRNEIVSSRTCMLTLECYMVEGNGFEICLSILTCETRLLGTFGG